MNAKLAKQNGKAEIFHFIQGEGKTLVSQVFLSELRHAICTVFGVTQIARGIGKNAIQAHKRCLALSPKKCEMEEMISELSVEEICKEVAKTNCENIVLTGGKPVMQLKESSCATSKTKSPACAPAL